MRTFHDWVSDAENHGPVLIASDAIKKLVADSAPAGVSLKKLYDRFDSLPPAVIDSLIRAWADLNQMRIGGSLVQWVGDGPK